MLKLLNLLFSILFVTLLAHADDKNKDAPNKLKSTDENTIVDSQASGFTQPPTADNCALLSGVGNEKAKAQACGNSSLSHCPLTKKECSGKDVVGEGSSFPNSSSTGAGTKDSGDSSPSSPSGNSKSNQK